MHEWTPSLDEWSAAKTGLNLWRVLGPWKIQVSQIKIHTKHCLPWCKKNPTNLWSFAKSKKQNTSCIAPLYIDQDDLCSDPLTKSDILIKHFQSVFTNEDFSTMPRISMSSYPTMSHITIHTSGVENLLRNLNPHKVTGSDATPAHILCGLSAEVAPAS